MFSNVILCSVAYSVARYATIIIIIIIIDLYCQ